VARAANAKAEKRDNHLKTSGFPGGPINQGERKKETRRTGKSAYPLFAFCAFFFAL
jgi:hypothetical protein